ncbi:hypothetical protein [Dechloromonas sp. A34]|uniref:hypothetical protein n=1 Tax=Dechloromonas sp. A34 TaxID=447588 RepID=UPI0022499E75|nr:hypothetical protein [Dechloromonas sp. A34]
MNSPLQLLRDLFPFSQPAADRRPAVQFQEGLPATADLPPLATVGKLSSDLLPAIAGQADLQIRFKQLEDAWQQAETALPVLEAEIAQAVLPLPPEATHAAIQADNLLKGLALAYTDIARGILAHPHDAGLGHLRHRAIRRALAMVARRQLLACRAYASPSPNSWRLLHELYQMACDPSAKPLNGETAPIEHAYLGALLFAYLEPNKLPRTELALIHACTDQLAAYATIGHALPEMQNNRSADACFLVRPDAATPGYPLARLPVGISTEGGLIVDCSQVLAALDRNLARQPGQPVQPQLDAPASLLHGLRIIIAGRSTRRFSRTQFKPRADLVGGLDQVITFLDGHACSRRALDAVGRHDGHDLSESEWSLVDESPDGFLIRFIRGEKSKIGAGDIVALQPRESSKIHVCLVRRIATTRNRLELGLQLLAPQVSLVDLPTPENASRRAIYLPSLPAYGKFSGLITQPGTLLAGQQITLNTLGRTRRHQIGQCIERNDGLEFVALDPLPD